MLKDRNFLPYFYMHKTTHNGDHETFSWARNVTSSSFMGLCTEIPVVA